MWKKHWRYATLGMTFFVAVIAAFIASESSAANGPFGFVPQSQYIHFNSELNCVEALVRASAPRDSSAQGAEKILQARERAEVLFYVRLVDFLFGARIEGGDIRMSSVYSAEGRSRIDRFSWNAVGLSREQNVGGHIMRNIDISEGRWDGRFYTIYGRFPMP
jgi:hypothetical protein